MQTGLLRVAADLSIDTHPLPSELPVVVTGLVLLILIPSNVSLSDSLGINEVGDNDAVDVGAVARADGAVAGGEGVDGGLSGLLDMREMPWSSCHVLTTSLIVALLNLGAPPHRGLGAPLVVGVRARMCACIVVWLCV